MGRSAFAVLLFPGYRGRSAGGDDPAAGRQRWLSRRWRHLPCPRSKVAGALVLVVAHRALCDPSGITLRGPFRSARVFSAVALFPGFGFGLLLEEVGLSMAIGGLPRRRCWRARNIATRWKATSSRLRGCCWGCSSLASGCRLIFGTLMSHPLRILVLLVGFLIIKGAMLWLIAKPLGAPRAQRRWFAVLLGQE